MLTQRFPSDITYIDLDAHTVSLPEDPETCAVVKRGLPMPAAAGLEARISILLKEAGVAVEDCSGDSVLVDDCAFVMAPPPETNQGNVPLDTDGVRDAVLGFMTEVLEGYDEFLVPPSSTWRNDASVWFDIDGYLAQVCAVKCSMRPGC